jgi:hypothetical protein
MLVDSILSLLVSVRHVTWDEDERRSVGSDLRLRASNCGIVSGISDISLDVEAE